YDRRTGRHTKWRCRADTGGLAAYPAHLCEDRSAAEEHCLHRGNQYAWHHDSQCSDTVIRAAWQRATIGRVPRLGRFQWPQPASVADVAGTFGMPGAGAEALAAAGSRVIVSNAIPT